MHALTAAALATLLTTTPGALRPRPSTETSTSTQASAPPLTDAEVATRVREYLGAIDRPVSADSWRGLGPRAVGSLSEVARSPAELPSRRARALAALGAIGGADARATVLGAVRDEALPFAVRASALRAAGRLLAPAALNAELRPVLEGRAEAPLRNTAAEVLARHGGAAGCSAVRRQALRATGDARAPFERALATCPPPAP